MKSSETTCFASSRVYDADSVNIAQAPIQQTQWVSLWSANSSAIYHFSPKRDSSEWNPEAAESLSCTIAMRDLPTIQGFFEAFPTSSRFFYTDFLYSCTQFGHKRAKLGQHWIPDERRNPKNQAARNSLTLNTLGHLGFSP